MTTQRPSPKIQVKTVFAQRFKEIQRQLQVSRPDLCKLLAVADATIRRWESGQTQPTVEDIGHMAQAWGKEKVCWLLSIEPEEECNGIVWTEHIPRHASEQQKAEISLGIHFFRLLIENERKATEVTSTLGADWQTLNGALLMALRTQALQLVEVPRDDDKASGREAQLRRLFPNLKRVLVVKIPQTESGNFMDGAVVKTELVTFLAATAALGLESADTRGIGVGGGYTMLRFAEQSVLCPTPFNKTSWIPLMARNDTGFEASGRSPNSVASLMAIQHPSSKAMYLPYIPRENRSRLSTIDYAQLAADEQQAALTINRFRNASTFFLTVGGKEYDAVLAFEDYSLKLRERIYNALNRRGVADRFAGDVLGIALNDAGESIDPDVQAVNDDAVFTIGLEKLRNLTKMNRTWLIAALPYKRRAVLMALKSGLVNSLVIDSEIADYLITATTETNAPLSTI